MTEDLNTSSTPASAKGEILSGAALGCLVGFLAGFSLTGGTTSIVLTTLVAGVASFLGIATTSVTSSIQANNHRRIAGFCFSAIIATVIATFVRTHDLLSPEPKYVTGLYDELVRVGYEPQKAREMVAARYFTIGSTASFPGNATGTGTNAQEPQSK